MSTTTTTTPAEPIDPGRVYTPKALAQAIGRSTRHVYDLCRKGALRHAGTWPPAPDGRARGPITITGQAWLDYRKSCEVGGIETEEGEEDLQNPPGASTPARTRRARRSRAPATAANPWLGYKVGDSGRATG